MKRLPGQMQLPLRLSSQGGQGQRWWPINGVSEKNKGNGVLFMLNKVGEYQVLVMDESGQTASVNVTR